jgi:enoyl-CoA hydratase
MVTQLENDNLEEMNFEDNDQLLDIKDLSIFSLFNYSTFNVSLIKETSSAVIKLKDHRINQEMLFELETLLNWFQNHVEIKSILIVSCKNYFGIGIDQKEIFTLDINKIQKFFMRIRKVISLMIQLPQVVIVDFGKGAQGASLELAMGADLRYSNQNAFFSFPQLKEGYLPFAGGLAILALSVPLGLLKNWVLSGKKISARELVQNGIISEVYEDDTNDTSIPSCILKILSKINKQSSVSRMQCKKFFQDGPLNSLEKNLNLEQKISYGIWLSEDYKEFLASIKELRTPKFMDPKVIMKALRKMLNPSLNQEESLN